MTMKIAFSDIDGTLLNKDREVSPALKKEVRRITENGVPFILISSRMPAAMTHLQDDLRISGLPLIAYNGGWVLVDGQAIHSEEIPLHIVREIDGLRSGSSLSVQLFHGHEWYVESMDFYALREENNTKVSPSVRKMKETTSDWQARNISAHKVMVMGEPAELDVLVEQLEREFDRELHLYRSKDTYLEIASKRISKLTGIEMLLANSYPDFSLADCIAFGDNFNDVEMLQAVGMGVAVANAKAAVLAVADRVVATNKEDGVAEGLHSLVV
ncbi:Cof-type HAD-IIB family hydrolase [Neolewinella agarilytica]|uniref:Cof-type HAD-IIB family hydrolase n=1 Tax=Neolewinella agarilytica TaxID=478744 RepID=UPI0023532310|nr:Cof-type HAD-IIB family hydrolase [Neolewinella agarilytica]